MHVQLEAGTKGLMPTKRDLSGSLVMQSLRLTHVTAGRCILIRRLLSPVSEIMLVSRQDELRF